MLIINLKEVCNLVVQTFLMDHLIKGSKLIRVSLPFIITEVRHEGGQTQDYLTQLIDRPMPPSLTCYRPILPKPTPLDPNRPKKDKA